MSANKGTTPGAATPGLPEKEWFTLEEIAQRWGADREALLHFAETGSLEVCRLLSKLDSSPFEFARQSVSPKPYRIAPQRVHLFCNHETELPPVKDVGVPGVPGRFYPLDLDEHGRPIASFGRVLDLIVTKAERDRFEAEYRVGAHAGAMPNPDHNDRMEPRLEKTYLQIIRVMSDLLDLPPEPYKAASMLAAHAREHGFGWPKKDDTVAGKLKATREL